MQLRTYEPADAETVLALNQSNLDGVGPLDEDRLAWLVSMADQAIVADADGELAAFCLTFGPETAYDSINYGWFRERYDSFGYLDRIVVTPSFRRRGLAGLVYDRAEEHARRYGLMALEVYCEPPNVASLAFHGARGYTEVGRLEQSNGKVTAMLVRTL